MDKEQVMKVDGLGAGGLGYVKVDFPSNSHRVAPATPEPKKIEKVISGGVVRKKKGARTPFS